MPQRCLYVTALVLAGLMTQLPSGAATVTLSGTVTNAETGLPAAGVPVGAVRVISLGTGEPDAEIPVEISGPTNSSGVFSYSIDNTAYQGLEQVLVFTQSSVYENKIYNGVAFVGPTPTYAAVALPGVTTVDFRNSVSGVNFSLEPLELPAKVTHLLSMTDGTRLATDVYLPSGTGPWPVVLYRTPYGKDSDHPGTEWTTGGYAVVAQDCRGTFDSEGLFRTFLDDGWGENKDGYETVLWIREQTWCNGKIGTLGGSARGITQNMLAGSAPPGLICQHVVVAASDLYSQGLFHDGAFRKRLIEGWVAGRGAAAYEYMMDEVTAHPLYDDALWGYVNLEPRYSLVNWPMVHAGGWYDIFLQGTINNFVGIQHNGGPGAVGRQKLIIEPYGHGHGDGGFAWPTEGLTARYASERNWFDEWIKGLDRHVMDDPPVCYYVLGDVDEPDGPGNEWRYADDWPVPATEVAYYFHDGGLLSTAPPTGFESPEAYMFDPADPVLTLGGANLSGNKGPYDQRPVESRGDVLVFTTPVIEEYVEITGKVLVRLWASSSAVDTDFTAKLCDVYPDGRSMLVCDGIVRARHRNTSTAEEFLTPGQIYEFEIDLWETCIAFNAGHRIRVDLSSSNYDRYDVNPNTGEPWNQHTHMQTAANTIYHDAAHPSHILLRVTSEVAFPPGNLPTASAAGLAVLSLTIFILAGLICLKRRSGAIL